MQGKGRALALHDGAGFVREAGFISRGMPAGRVVPPYTTEPGLFIRQPYIPAGRHGGRPYIIISGSR